MICVHFLLVTGEVILLVALIAIPLRVAVRVSDSPVRRLRTALKTGAHVCLLIELRSGSTLH